MPWPPGGWTIKNVFLTAVVLLGCLGIVYVAAGAIGFPIPPWVLQMGGIVLIVLLAVGCILLLASFLTRND